MAWQELGALGELIGAFAAVALLGYIAHQIRQNSRLLEHNSRATRAASLQGGTEFYIRFFELLARDPELASIWRRARTDQPIDEDERVRFEASLHVLLGYLEHAYLMAEMETYTVDVLSVAGSLVSDTLSNEACRAWWERDGHRAYRPEFVARINELLEASTEAIA